MIFEGIPFPCIDTRESVAGMILPEGCIRTELKDGGLARESSIGTPRASRSSAFGPAASRISRITAVQRTVFSS
ncbi:hypothetical protein G6F68_015903 [Rhizopus microsporus]|nr:hypothetical protein G6F68_015903 [Rhizopus microsporus]KAG1388318.1 hypothetical protein G6F59_016009 [Rhizopus arrhizus]